MTTAYAALGAAVGVLAAILLGAVAAVHPVALIIAVPLIASLGVFLAAVVRARPASPARRWAGLPRRLARATVS